MTAPDPADALRASLQLITQVCAAARTGPTAAHASIIARVDTIASIALTRSPGACVVNLSEPLSDLGLIRSALRAYKLNADDPRLGLVCASPPDFPAIDRLMAAMDAGQLALARSTRGAVVGGVPEDAPPPDDFG